MGSFDSVCGLSHMAISDGDPVVAMVIRRNPWPLYEQSPLYPYNIWEPATVLAYGKYADYGNVALDSASQADWALTEDRARQWYERTWLEPGERDGQFWEGRWYMKRTMLDYTFDKTGERPSLREEEKGVFSLWMAHRTIWETMIENATVEFFPNNHGKRIKEAITAIEKTKRDLMKGIVDPKDKQMNMLYNLCESRVELDRFPHMLRYSHNIWQVGGSGDSNNPAHGLIEEGIWDAFDAKDDKAFDVMVGHWRNSHMLATLLHESRRLLSPPGTIGPQHGHDQPHLVLAGAIMAQAAHNKVKWGNEFDEEDDDEG